MQKPQDGLVYEGLSLNGAEYLIIELSAVLSNDGEADEVQSTGNLLQARGVADYQSLTRYLGASAEVVRTPLEEIDLDDY
jgi:hypothetical protein